MFSPSLDTPPTSSWTLANYGSHTWPINVEILAARVQLSSQHLETSPGCSLIGQRFYSYHFLLLDNSRVHLSPSLTPPQPVILTLKKHRAVYILVESSYYQFAH